MKRASHDDAVALHASEDFDPVVDRLEQTSATAPVETSGIGKSGCVSISLSPAISGARALSRESRCVMRPLHDVARLPLRAKFMLIQPL